MSARIDVSRVDLNMLALEIDDMFHRRAQKFSSNYTFIFNHVDHGCDVQEGCCDTWMNVKEFIY